MKYINLLILSTALLSLCSCAYFDATQPKPVEIPVGKNWQIKEEPPLLSDEQGRLPFQKEQSLLPEGTKSLPSTDNRTIKTPL